MMQNPFANFSHQQQQPTLQQQQDQGQKKKDLKDEYKNILDKMEIEQMTAVFKKYDVQKTGFLFFHDFLTAVRQFYKVDDKLKEMIFLELDCKQIRKFDAETMLFVCSLLKQHEQKMTEMKEMQQSSEYIDAFIALGGTVDENGVIKGQVPKDTILKIIKEEFELTFDMEQFLEKIEASTEMLDYNTFCLLFEAGEEGRSMSKVSSVLSLLSQRSHKSTSTFQSLKLRQKDFEKFLIQYDHHDNKLQKDESVSSPKSPYSPNIY